MDGNNGSQVPQGDAPVTGRQVFLGNLPFTIQSKDLKDLFEKNGGISNVAVMLHANGRSRGFGLVTCESAETAQLLISQFRDLELLGRRIEVRLDRVGRAYNNLADDRKPHDGQSLSKRHAPQYANPPTTTTAACTPDSVSGTSAPQIASVAAAAAMLSNAPVSSTSSYHSLGAVGMYHPAIAAPTTNSYAHNWTPDTDHGFHPAVVDYNALQTFDVGNAIAGIDLNPGTRILVTPGVQDASYYSNNGGTATPPTQGSHSPPANGDPSVWTDTPPHTASDVPAAPSTFSNGGTNLFVGNLPFSTTWQGLKDLFRRAGDVVRAQVPIDSSGRSRGFGVVTMAQPEDAAKAVEMLNDFVFMGRSLEVREDRNTSKSFRTEGDQHEGGGYNGGYRTRKQTKGPPSVPSGNQEDQTDVTHPKDNQFLSNGSDPNTGDASGPTLFVGNLAYGVQWQELKDLFRSVCAPIRAEIAMSSPGRSRGFGFVTMASQEDADKAIQELNGVEVRNRKIEVRIDRFRGQNEQGAVDAASGTQVVVGNLPFHMRWQDLKDIFRCVAEPQIANVRIDPETGQSKGIGTVRFEDAKDATRALSLNGMVIAGRNLWVKIDK